MLKQIGRLSKKPQTADSGATLTENLVAMTVLTTTLILMFSGFMFEKEQNISQRILTEAITLSKETLDELRRQDITSLTLGSSTSSHTHSGYNYNLTQYICTQKPTINSDQSVTCPTPSSTDNLRYILLNIENQNNGKKIYTVETVFTELN